MVSSEALVDTYSYELLCRSAVDSHTCCLLQWRFENRWLVETHAIGISRLR